MYSISFLGQATVDVPAIVRLILKDQDIPEKPGVANQTTYDRLLKYASERIIQRKYGLAIHPYAVWRAVFVDKSIPKSELRKAENAVKAELKSIGIERGPKGMKGWFKAEEYAPIKGVKTMAAGESGFVAAAIQAGLESVGVKYNPAGTFLTHEECQRLRGGALSYIQKADIEDPDIRAKRASEELSMKQVGAVSPIIPFYRVMGSMGISCVVPIDPLAVAHNAIKKAAGSIRLEIVRKTTRYPVSTALTPASYDTLVTAAVPVSVQLWADHKRKFPDAKFRTREVTGGQAEWRRLVLERIQLLRYFRGELPEKLKLHDEESAKRAVQAIARTLLGQARLEPGPIPKRSWDIATGRKTYEAAGFAMMNLTRDELMRAGDMGIYIASLRRPSRLKTQEWRGYCSMTRRVAETAVREMGYQPVGLVAPAVVRPVVTPTPAVEPPVVTRVEPPVVRPLVTAPPALVAPTAPPRSSLDRIKQIIYERAKLIPKSRRERRVARWLSRDQYEKFIRDCVADVIKADEALGVQLGFGPVTPTADRQAEIRQLVGRYMTAYGVLRIPVTVTPAITPVTPTVRRPVERPKEVAIPTAPSPVPVAPPPARRVEPPPARVPEPTRWPLPALTPSAPSPIPVAPPPERRVERRRLPEVTPIFPAPAPTRRPLPMLPAL